MKLLDKIVALIYPRNAICLSCGSVFGSERNDLCEDCRKELSEMWVGVRQPRPSLGLDGAAYAYHYRGPAGKLVRQLKYASVRVIADEMSNDLVRAVQLLRIADLYAVTCVPMHPKRLRVRGFNQSELIARKVADSIGIPFVPLLMRTRNARQQAKLKREERLKNLKDGFAILDGTDIKGKCVLLIDDVMTTGSTSANCAKALRDAGAERVFFAAYAIGE